MVKNIANIALITMSTMAIISDVETHDIIIGLLSFFVWKNLLYV